jgi:DNA-binding response OmpR family regulator
MAAKRVYVVDDNPDIVTSVRLVFKSRAPDIEVVGFTSGKDVLAAIRQDKPDLILLDLMMPVMSGWDVTAAMRADQKLKGIPIIYVTAKTDEMTKEAGKFIGSDYITKPYDNDDLVKRVKEALAKAKG